MSTTPTDIAFRLEALPIGRWHVRVAVALGVATFFDGFDALSIAFVMPVLVRLWQLTPVETGMLIGIGYVGQAIGALLFARFADSHGRIVAIRGAMVVIGLFSLACALARTPEQLALARLVQGIGLGGEVPVAAAYMSEIAGAGRRGRLFFLYQSSFGIGIIAAGAAGALMVPVVGWQALFLVGALPLPLALVFGRVVPESPRWLAANGRIDESHRILATIERGTGPVASIAPRPEVDQPPPVAQAKGRVQELFRRDLRNTTVVTAFVWVACTGTLYALGTWLPTLLTEYYKLPLRTALGSAFAVNVFGLFSLGCLALVADRVSRRTLIATAITFAAMPLFALALAGGGTAVMVIVLAALTQISLNIAAPTLFLYTPELYPARLRALGTGFASACTRIATILLPPLVGWMLQYFGPAGVFTLFAVMSLAGGIAAWISATDTRRRVLDGHAEHQS